MCGEKMMDKKSKILIVTADELRHIADGISNPQINNKLEHHNIRVQDIIKKMRQRKLYLRSE